MCDAAEAISVWPHASVCTVVGNSPGALALTRTLPNVDEVVNYAYQVWGELDDFGWWRWRVAGASSSVAAILLLLLYGARRRLAVGLKIVLLCCVISVLFWGPIPVIAVQMDYMAPPISGLRDSWQLSVAMAAVRGLTGLPLALLLGFPATATLFALMRGNARDWFWYEWLGWSVRLSSGWQCCN